MFFLSLSFIFYSSVHLVVVSKKKLMFYGKIMIFNEVIANLIVFVF